MGDKAQMGVRPVGSRLPNSDNKVYYNQFIIQKAVGRAFILIKG